MSNNENFSENPQDKRLKKGYKFRIGETFVGTPTIFKLKYDRTKRDRRLYDQGENNPSQTYVGALFNFGGTPEEIKNLLKELLEGKKILLMGGGESTIGKQLNEMAIQPEAVINVDPFIEEEIEGADPVIKLSASDPNLPKVLAPIIDHPDEIWCLFSVPYYLQADQIEGFFANLKDLSRPGTTTRIYPMDSIAVGTRENEANIEARKEAIIKAIDLLIADPQYALYLDRGLMKIVKVGL